VHIEVLACVTPLYDVERVGVATRQPQTCGYLRRYGRGERAEQERHSQTYYHQLPEPKVVVAVGTCASSGGIFRECYNISGGVDAVIPVDVYVPGCAARPEAIIDGVVKALAVLEDKQRAMIAMANSIDQTLFLRADKNDAPEILALQKVAYQSEAEIYGDDSLPPCSRRSRSLRPTSRICLYRGRYPGVSA